MRVLLDTHALLWWSSSAGSRLSDTARGLIGAPDTDVLVSVVSAAEVVIKAARARIEMPDAADRYVPAMLMRHDFSVLELRLDHALRLASLPPIHRDPWDRLLIAQAQVEGLPIVTADPAIARYDVEVIW